jgi:circadian clock protein KaiC
MKNRKGKSLKNDLSKTLTGIRGLDEITFGGLPEGRPTLVTGSAGSGKTLLGMEFLINGVREFGENGVFISFEESDKELITNVSSLGFSLDELTRKNKIIVDYIHIDPDEIEETGEYDLEGLFIRIGHSIDSIGAKRIVLDTIECLFSGFSNPAILRAELRRLFRWLKDIGITAIITGERGNGSLTRQGLEEYVSDCVIVLDNRVFEESSTRRMRIVKYRGSAHGTNEYPFIIDENGFSVLPITSMSLSHEVSTDRISSGIADLDKMLDNSGFYRGSSILVSGTAGTGKSIISAQFADAACLAGEKVLYFSFEESPAQIMRNMNSVGIELQKHVNNGLLNFHAMRSTNSGLELLLVTIHKEIAKFAPSVVILDPVNSFITGGNKFDARAMSLRLIDYLKTEKITCFMTCLANSRDMEDNFISSFIDSWILLRDLDSNGDRHRGILILKSRGMAHSNEIREFKITSSGIKLYNSMN